MLTRTPFACILPPRGPIAPARGPGAAYADAYQNAATRGRRPASPVLMRPGCLREDHADLAALGRRVQELRGRMGLERKPRTFSIPGCDTLQGFDLFAVDRDTGGQIWLGTTWPGDDVDARAFDAAVKAERPAKLAPAA